MSDRQFASGDVVTLKSAGQGMMVEDVKGVIAHVIWFSKDGRLRRDAIPLVCLRHSQGEFDGIGDLIIEGVTHTRTQIQEYLEAAGHA